MKSKRVKFIYDAEDDAAYLKFGSGRVIESEEVQPGVIVDYGGGDQIVGVEILRFRNDSSRVQGGPGRRVRNRCVDRRS